MVNYGEGEELAIPVGPAQCPGASTLSQPLSGDAHLGDKEARTHTRLPDFLALGKALLGTATLGKLPCLACFLLSSVLSSRESKNLEQKDPNGFLFIPLVCIEFSQDKHKDCFWGNFAEELTLRKGTDCIHGALVCPC